MKNIKKNAIVLLVIISFVGMMTVSQINYTKAYGAGDGTVTNDGTHGAITQAAIDVLRNDGYTNIADEIDAHYDRIALAQHDADWQGELFGYPVAARNHYMDAQTHAPLLPGCESAGNYGQTYFDKAVDEFKQNKISDAWYHFGKALHVLQDLTVPHHAHNEMFAGHSEYEGLIYTSYITSTTSSGYYTFSSLSGHYNDDTAFGWIDRAAHYSYGYFSYVDDPNDNSQYRYVQSILLPKAVRLSAGFLKFFYDKTHPFAGGLYFPKATYSKLSFEVEFKKYDANPFSNTAKGKLWINIESDQDTISRYLRIYIDGNRIDQKTINYNGFNGEIAYSSTTGKHIVTLEIYYGGYKTYGWKLVNFGVINRYWGLLGDTYGVGKVLAAFFPQSSNSEITFEFPAGKYGWTYMDILIKQHDDTYSRLFSVYVDGVLKVSESSAPTLPWNGQQHFYIGYYTKGTLHKLTLRIRYGGYKPYGWKLVLTPDQDGFVVRP
ncbi:hypothetical protein [Candidatus Harpocratesius sp.]